MFTIPSATDGGSGYGKENINYHLRSYVCHSVNFARDICGVLGFKKNKLKLNWGLYVVFLLVACVFLLMMLFQ